MKYGVFLAFIDKIELEIETYKVETPDKVKFDFTHNKWVGYYVENKQSETKQRVRKLIMPIDQTALESLKYIQPDIITSTRK